MSFDWGSGGVDWNVGDQWWDHDNMGHGWGLPPPGPLPAPDTHHGHIELPTWHVDNDASCSVDVHHNADGSVDFHAGCHDVAHIGH